jgi:hypothetical protein
MPSPGQQGGSFNNVTSEAKEWLVCDAVREEVLLPRSHGRRELQFSRRIQILRKTKE